MDKIKIPVISIVGRAKTGKTTFIEKLIPVLMYKDIKVAVIKHHLHDFEFDIPGKDTYRHKKAGAKTVILSSPGKIAMVKDTEKDLSIEEIISGYIDDIDLLITEGYKKEDMPKIEVYPKKEGAEPVCIDDRNLVAIITDIPFTTHVPVFQRDDIEGVAGFILTKFKLAQGA
ncbi:MAG: molybdopterin-guanine dinucleotide biosynthesis protein B [Proteobacteria bacterium]|nr:molybdopterin-guanine dinucleotide biosynthesis protein B [Pseudomonadota bacterium]